MNKKLRLVLAIVLITTLSACGTFDNLTKIPVENLSTTPEFEATNFYNGKTLALTVFSPDGSFDDFRYGDSTLISYGELFAKSMQEKRPLIKLVSQNELTSKLSNRDFVAISTRIARNTVADPSDIDYLAKSSGADYIAIAKIRGFSSRSEAFIFSTPPEIVEYKSAESTFIIYNAKTGNYIWSGNFDHESDDSWGTPSWKYMMERMYDGFVLRLPLPNKTQ